MSFKLYLILLLNLILFISGYSQKLGSTITDLNSQKQLHDYHNISCCEINEKGKNEKFNRSLIGSITHIEVENNSPLLLVEGQNPEITYQITVISALKDVSRVEIKSLNCLGSTISLVDNGSNNDAAANDNIYTGTGLVCNQLPTIAQDEILDIGYLPHNERIELSITFTDGTEEEYIFRKNIFIIPQKFEEEIIASSSISQLNDSVQYASNVINWVAPKQLNCNRPDYDTKQIRLEFESIWSEFPSPNVVVFSPNDVNEGKYLVDGSFDGSRMTLFRIDPVIINHELNHKWVRSALNYNLPSNSGHWGFIQRNSSGFGKACYNGVFDSLYLNGTSVNYDIQFPPDGLWDDYNDIELYLMGLISIDEISFPITYVDNGQCSFGGNFNGGELKYYNKSDLQSYIEEYPAVRTLVIKDSLVLPIIIVTEKKLNETELLMYNRFAIDYESYFKERTQDLGVLSTKIYKLPVDEDNDGYDIAEDCDDNNPDINPGQTEEPYNGIDDDCNSATFDDDLD